MKPYYFALAGALSVCFLTSLECRLFAESKSTSNQLVGTLEALDIEKQTVTIALPHPIDRNKLNMPGIDKFPLGGMFQVMKPQTHPLAKEVKTTIAGVPAKLSNIKNVAREAQKPMPGCGCKHGVQAVLKLAEDGKTVTEIHVLEVTDQLLAVNLKKETVTITMPEYLRDPVELNLFGKAPGQPKVIGSFAKPHAFNLSNKVRIVMDGKVVTLADLKKVARESRKADPKCGCLPPGARVTLVLTEDCKTVTQINVLPDAKSAPQAQKAAGGLSTKQ